jgi:quercetin dioxygenase-like cupin family protein
MKALLPFLFLAGAAIAQDSRVVVDNDQVKVLKVEVHPHQKTPPHSHAVSRVMIYLEAGKQSFDYEGGKHSVLEWKAGQALWSPASGTHVAEIVSDKPVTIVEVELKKPGPATAAAPGALDPVKVDPGHYKVEFENDQVRVLRVRVGPHESAPLHEHNRDRVVAYLTPYEARVSTEDGKSDRIEHKAGDVGWGAYARHKEDNLAAQPFELIAVELKAVAAK